MKNGLISKAVLVAGVLLSGQASASTINVGGVMWDPEAVGPNADFLGKGELVQWAQNTATINSADAVAVATPNSLVGTSLFGTSIFTSINGVNGISGSPFPETTPANFCPNCELTMVWGGIKVNGLTTTDLGAGNFIYDYSFDISNAWAKVYVDSPADYSTGVPGDYADAMDGQLFLDLKVDFFDWAPSLNVIGGTAEAYFSVLDTAGALATEHFDTDTLKNGSDIQFTSSAQFPLSASPTFSTGTFEVQSDTVPEPSTIALMGLGLIGAGVASRRRKIA